MKKIEILFYENTEIFSVGNVINVDTLDEMKETLKSFFEKCESKYFVYAWSKYDCGCGIGLGDNDDEEYETDADKMIDKIVNRIGEYGWCSFEGEFGDFRRIFVCDTESEGGKKYYSGYNKKMQNHID